jgi:hypothetical protein
MYRRPKTLDKRITDELYEKLMDIANEEADNFITFGSPSFHTERAVISAANRMLEAVDAGKIKPKKAKGKK